ncbi:DMT family transporter [Puniceibacterium sp. IMCC21224]|uniref:DMT family transporter n=1 Tax=Puniceibacterium sp. IMCC21224 TaxID=1618204 RepID=UPI00064E0FAC|nr:DMT family transporter [Puniceibacterium sp. IMCC21224]KMK66821.1 putative permease [Puniceibacterium sp. IMCC21224]
MHKDNPLLGILLMLGFCIVAPMGDAVAKLLGGQVPLAQLLLVRFGIQAIALIPFLLLTRRSWRLRGRLLALTILRTLLHILGIGMMFSALMYLPLADAVAIAFIMPFLMLILGHFVLGEEVGMRRLLACAVGFIGTLLVVQPAFAEVGWPALLPLGVAVNFSVFMLVTRQIARQTDPIGLQAVSGVMAVCLIAPLVILIPADAFPALAWESPSRATWSLLIGIGLLGTLAHLLMTWSLRFAPSATLAPMQYLEIPIATIIGFAVFGDLPNALAAIGICVTVAAGLYIVIRERSMMLSARAMPQVPSQVPTPAE